MPRVLLLPDTAVKFPLLTDPLYDGLKAGAASVGGVAVPLAVEFVVTLANGAAGGGDTTETPEPELELDADEFDVGATAGTGAD